MSLEALLLLLAFLGLLVLPLVPGLRELWRPRDNRALEIDPDASVNPRDAGLRFREALRAAAARGAPTPGGTTAQPGVPEVHADLRLPSEAEAPALLVVLGEAEVGERGRLGEVYAQGHARLGAGVRLRSLAADGDIVLGHDCVVEDWLDTEATAWIGPRCELGRSASAAKGLHLSEGCVFRRLWGLPVSVDAPAEAAGSRPTPGGERREVTIEDTVLWVGRHLTLPAGLVLERDLVVHGALRVGPGAIVRGSLKAHGAMHLGEGVRVEANVIGRRDIHIAGGARIAGNVYAERDVVIGPGTQIGQPEGFKSVYAAGRVTLAHDVLVYGWVVAERGGGVVRAS